MSSTPAFRRALTAYLATPRGQDTAPVIAELLGRIDPKAVGMGPRPSLAHVHHARLFLEDVLAGQEPTP